MTPDEPTSDLLKWAITAVIALSSAICGWFAVRLNRVGDRVEALERLAVLRPELDKTNDRVGELERAYVSQEALREAIKSMRDDRLAMHKENRETMTEMRMTSEAHLTRIEQKMDQNEERSAKTRHDIRNTVNELVAKIHFLEKVEQRRSNEEQRNAGDG